ncbi:D-alanyl carrier protein [Streptomyces sp. NTH33]|uniref:acyl carrier protein n=1 Tax=Streptomyces sp. NTH33 TaxID=1735453 RepID=UPI000DAA2D95|nr:acyl carrier protein [Streptomyces sp. NTH33]PZH19199.1 D-alanyl carrier protein [Streptomyces sp. NTH33]
MTHNDVKARIREFLAPHLGGQEVADGDDIFALGYVNSLFAMQLVLFIEKEFSLQLGAEDMEFDNFRTVSGLVRLVNANAAAAV